MRHDSGKDMSLRVSAYTSYDLNALTPVVWKLCWCKDVCVSTSRRKNK